MFERFTERARHVVILAQQEAKDLNHAYIGTEHLLLGLLREEEGVAARVLHEHHVTIEAVRVKVREIVGTVDTPVPLDKLPFTPRAQKALELALREALSLGHNYIGTEHVLLGLVRESGSIGGIAGLTGKGIALKVLESFGLTAEGLRADVMRVLSKRSESKQEFGRELYIVVPVGPPSSSSGRSECFITMATSEDLAVEAAHVTFGQGKNFRVGKMSDLTRKQVRVQVVVE